MKAEEAREISDRARKEIEKEEERRKQELEQKKEKADKLVRAHMYSDLETYSVKEINKALKRIAQSAALGQEEVSIHEQPITGFVQDPMLGEDYRYYYSSLDGHPIVPLEYEQWKSLRWEMIEAILSKTWEHLKENGYTVLAAGDVDRPTLYRITW